MKIITLLLLCSIALFSCISIDTEIELKQDGSGTVRLSYTVDKMLVDVGSFDDGSSVIPLPVDEENFRISAAAVPGLSMNSFSQDENDTEIYIDAVLDFSSVEALNTFISAAEDSIVYVSEDGKSVYRHTIFRAPEGGTDEETLAFADSFFSDYELSFRLKSPAAIQSVNRGSIGDEPDSAHYRIPLNELLRTEETIIWEVSW
jgi:hypothetical protein